MKIHITKNTFHWKLDLESLSTAPVWCSVLSIEPLKHNGKWVIVHYMAFVFRYEILASESEWDYRAEATVEEGGVGSWGVRTGKGGEQESGCFLAFGSPRPGGGSHLPRSEETLNW